MCCSVLPAWQNFVAPAYSCSRQLYTLCSNSRSHMLTCQSAKHLSNVYQQTSHYVQSLLRSSSLSTSSNYEFPCRWPRGYCSSVVHQPEVLTISRSLSSSVIYPKVKTLEHQNHSRLNFCRSRHFMPRHLAPSTKTIIDASPVSLQPYLRLIRFDRPIGMTC